MYDVSVEVLLSPIDIPTNPAIEPGAGSPWNIPAAAAADPVAADLSVAS